MKTSAPVSTLRYHSSGASWAALIQHLGSIPKAVQYSVTRFSLSSDHFASHDDVGEAIVVHARDAAGVVEARIHGFFVPINRSTYFFNVVEASECFWTVPGQSGAELPIFICP